MTQSGRGAAGPQETAAWHQDADPWPPYAPPATADDAPDDRVDDVFGHEPHLQLIIVSRTRPLVLAKHPLDLFEIVCLRERQHQQDASLLGIERVGRNHSHRIVFVTNPWLTTF